VRKSTGEEVAKGGSASDYKVGPGRKPLQPRFKKGQSGNSGGIALDETVVVTIDGRRRKITKREAIITEMVDKLRVPICARPRC
jgi:hypothetical protein